MKARAFFLGLVGLLQMVGNCGHLPWLQKAGLSTAASPAPKVFCAMEGRESFEGRYFLDWKDAKGEAHSLPIDHHVLARFQGPETRRAMYLFTLEGRSGDWAPFTRSVERRIACGPLLKEWGLDPGLVQWPVTVRIAPANPSGHPLSIPYGEPCP